MYIDSSSADSQQEKEAHAHSASSDSQRSQSLDAKHQGTKRLIVTRRNLLEATPAVMAGIIAGPSLIRDLLLGVLRGSGAGQEVKEQEEGEFPRVRCANFSSKAIEISYPLVIKDPLNIPRGVKTEVIFTDTPADLKTVKHDLVARLRFGGADVYELFNQPNQISDHLPKPRPISFRQPLRRQTSNQQKGFFFSPPLVLEAEKSRLKKHALIMPPFAEILEDLLFAESHVFSDVMHEVAAQVLDEVRSARNDMNASYQWSRKLGEDLVRSIQTAGIIDNTTRSLFIESIIGQMMLKKEEKFDPDFYGKDGIWETIGTHRLVRRNNDGALEPTKLPDVLVAYVAEAVNKMISLWEEYQFDRHESIDAGRYQEYASAYAQWLVTTARERLLSIWELDSFDLDFYVENILYNQGLSAYAPRPKPDISTTSPHSAPTVYIAPLKFDRMEEEPEIKRVFVGMEIERILAGNAMIVTKEFQPSMQLFLLVAAAVERYSQQSLSMGDELGKLMGAFFKGLIYSSRSGLDDGDLF